MATRKAISKALADRARDEEKLASFNATLPNIAQPRYEDVCGDKGRRDIFSQFSDQIGCFAEDEHPSDWIASREKFRGQFDKARQCFYGRVKRMDRFTANTAANRESRNGHAFAAKAAYTLGRNCLRKFSDVPGTVAEDRFQKSADELIDSLSQDGVKAALRANGNTIHEGVLEDPALKELYERTYDLEPEHWETYRKYAVLTAPDFNVTKYDGGEAMLRIDEKKYLDTFFETKPKTPESAGAVGGAGMASTNNTTRRTKKKKGKKTSKNKKTTVRAMENAVAFNAALAEAVAKNTAETSRFPELETVTYDALQKDAEGKLFHYEDVKTWYELPRVQTLIKLIDGVGTSERLENQFMLEIIAPFLYYKASFEIGDLIHYIINNDRLEKQSKFFTLFDHILVTTLKGRLYNDYLRLKYYLYSNLFNKSKVNPLSLTIHDVWSYLAVVENNLVKGRTITKKMRDRAVKNPILNEWAGLREEYGLELTTTYAKNIKGVKSTTTKKNKRSKPSAAASN